MTTKVSLVVESTGNYREILIGYLPNNLPHNNS